MCALLRSVLCSGYDFGYLLKILTCQPLPNTEDEFFELLKAYFPNIIDIKYIIKQPQCAGALHGGLKKISELLDVREEPLPHTHTHTAQSARPRTELVASYRGTYSAWHRPLSSQLWQPRKCSEGRAQAVNAHTVPRASQDVRLCAL